MPHHGRVHGRDDRDENQSAKSACNLARTNTHNESPYFFRLLRRQICVRPYNYVNKIFSASGGESRCRKREIVRSPAGSVRLIRENKKSPGGTHKSPHSSR